MKKITLILIICFFVCVSVTASVFAIYLQSSGGFGDTLPASFKLGAITEEEIEISLESQRRISTVSYSEIGTKNVILPQNGIAVVTVDTPYLFSVRYDTATAMTEYNGRITVIQSEDGEYEAVVEDIACNVNWKYSQKSAGTVYETEPNDNFDTATLTYDDYDNFGVLSHEGDEDLYAVSFNQYGYANFWLGDIPAGCDYDLMVFSDGGHVLLAESNNGNNSSELITLPIHPGSQYYVGVISYSGASYGQYMMRVKMYNDVIVDRHYSTFEKTAPYRDHLKFNMNCYGYALHVCSRYLQGTTNHYAQLVGEFSGLYTDRISLESDNALTFDTYGENVEQLFDHFESLMFADFTALRNQYGDEWMITPTTRTAAVPDGTRKIAMAIDKDEGYEYHFYLRHSNGVWSHKNSDELPRTSSFTTEVLITDDNIGTAALEGVFNDGVRYYLIGKSAVIDYPHSNMLYSDTLPATRYFHDRAGDEITGAVPLTQETTSCCFDYPGDADYFEFIPSTTGIYNFTTTEHPSQDINIFVFDSDTHIVAYAVNVGTPDLDCRLTSGERYYIAVSDANLNFGSYELSCTAP